LPARTQQFTALLREARISSSLTILISQAIAERLGVHATDIETMVLLDVHGPMTAGHLAERAGLTSGATTRLVDRLEAAGFVRRRSDPNDRRRVIIEPDWENAVEIVDSFATLTERMRALWEGYSAGELETITEYLRRCNEILSEQNAALRGHAAPPEGVQG